MIVLREEVGVASFPITTTTSQKFAMTSQLSDSEIPLPRFLKELGNNGIPIPKAMAIAGKMLSIDCIMMAVMHV